MRQYNYDQIDEHIQWLIEMMEIEFPNGYELVIDSAGAKIRSTQQYLFLNKRFKDNMTSLIGDINPETVQKGTLVND